MLEYRVRTDGLVFEFSLDTFGVREGSERIQVDGVTLTRGSNYTVDYSTGTVRLMNPQQLSGGRQSPRISATFEQNPLFQIAPKSISAPPRAGASGRRARSTSSGWTRVSAPSCRPRSSATSPTRS